MDNNFILGCIERTTSQGFICPIEKANKTDKVQIMAKEPYIRNMFIRPFLCGNPNDSY